MRAQVRMQPRRLAVQVVRLLRELVTPAEREVRHRPMRARRVRVVVVQPVRMVRERMVVTPRQQQGRVVAVVAVTAADRSVSMRPV